jgi:hypothetical protein
MARKLTFEEKQANRQERKIRGYCHTAIRKLIDKDYANGCTAAMVAAAMPVYNREIRQFVEQAMQQVNAINVPARAVKLYEEWSER